MQTVKQTKLAGQQYYVLNICGQLLGIIGPV